MKQRQVLLTIGSKKKVEWISSDYKVGDKIGEWTVREIYNITRSKNDDGTWRFGSD